MFGAFNTFGKLGAIGKAIAAAWSPLSLWPDGIDSPGMWISPRTLDSQWQDYTGTTPVATPGTVADSSNPVGLALDIRAGATVLTDPGNHMLQSTSAARPLLSARVNLLAYTGDLSGWNKDAGVTITPNYGTAPDSTSTSVRVQFSGASMQTWLTGLNGGGNPGILSVWVKGVAGETIQIAPDFSYPYTVTLTGAWQKVENYSVIANAFSLHTYGGSTARDVEVWHPQFQLGLTATDYQPILTDGSSYSSTGFPIAQKYDGVDDGMATAAFSAGTLIDGMDCMIAVRRDSSANTTLGLNQTNGGIPVFGFCAASVGDVTSFGCGTPTVWVDNVQLTGGTLVTQDTLHNAVTVGDWHIVEYRNLDMSSFTQARFGSAYPGHLFTGPRGDIMFYPSTASTEDKDAARQWLADYYGVTLP